MQLCTQKSSTFLVRGFDYRLFCNEIDPSFSLSHKIASEIDLNYEIASGYFYTQKFSQFSACGGHQ
jgi:hypothetical protein